MSLIKHDTHLQIDFLQGLEKFKPNDGSIFQASDTGNLFVNNKKYEPFNPHELISYDFEEVEDIDPEATNWATQQYVDAKVEGVLKSQLDNIELILNNIIGE